MKRRHFKIADNHIFCQNNAPFLLIFLALFILLLMFLVTVTIKAMHSKLDMRVTYQKTKTDSISEGQIIVKFIFAQLCSFLNSSFFCLG
jgi:hypothetical protein